MKKIPDHLKIIKMGEPPETVPENSPPPEPEISSELQFDPKEVQEIMEKLETEINKVLSNNTVRNIYDFEHLLETLENFQRKVLIMAVAKSEDMLAAELLSRLLIRLSDIKFNIKKEPYEVAFCGILYEVFVHKLLEFDPEQLQAFYQMILNNKELLNLRPDWLLNLISYLAVLANNIPETDIPFELIEKFLDKMLNEGPRLLDENYIEIQSDLLHLYLLKSIALGYDLDYILTFLGNHRYDYGVFPRLTDYILGDTNIPEAYKFVKGYVKKGNMNHFFNRVDERENRRITASVYNFLYHCLCLNYFDYFENIFPFFSKLTKNRFKYRELIHMYNTYAPKKRVDRFIRESFGKESKLSKRAQNSLRRAILGNN